MAIVAMHESPLACPSGFGPCRRNDHDAPPDEPRYELLLGRFYPAQSPRVAHQAVLLLLEHPLGEAAEAVGGLTCAAPLRRLP